ncbi:M1 family metallopeptidase [Luteimonas sp. SX5]|uniref:Aminopeptidase N n=1 Tax=Luteimonas galliterrae TaxID=2940486 RepID=A0ABT0MFH3_9GAMM|nr:M1 family metallopeptidase [Luteimonas galliterrae]MCL1633428.1 M1 family metallopeptidase [Luteimonas galliterrae]
MNRSFGALLVVLTAFSPVTWARQGALTKHTYDSGASRAPEQLAVVFEKADLQFKVDPAKKSLSGDAALTFRATAPVSRLVVDFDRNYAIRLVSIDGKPIVKGGYRNPDGRMAIDLPKPLAAGERAVLRIVYAGKPHVADRAPWDGGFVWAKAPTGEPWVASAVQLQGCDLFWPCIDHPMGEPLQVDQHITVPAPLVAAGNGVAMGMEEKDGWRTYHWRTRAPNTYAIALNIGPYEVLEADYMSRYGNIIPLRFWYLKGHQAKARVLFEEFPLMLDFFESYIGPYPFGDEKMGVAETPHLGMEHQSINAYGNEYVKTEFGYDELLQHEFAHEWFGNQLTNVDWDDMWLHEGYGSYMQPLYMEYRYGSQWYYALLHAQRTRIANKFPVVSGSNKPMGGVYDGKVGPGGDIYAKGSLILHTLRNLIGDKDFFAVTRQAVYGTDKPAPGNFKPLYLSTPEYIAIVDKVTGRDYRWFFDVYLYQAALPQLVATRDAKGLALRWKTPADKPFPMPVEVRVDGRDRVVAMKNGQGRVEMPAGAVYTIDPHSKVLRDLPYMDEFKADKAAREKAAADKAKKAAKK